MSVEDAIQQVLDCVCSALGAQGWEGECCLIPGNPKIEGCCEDGGKAWGRLVRMYPSARFPRQDQDQATECGAAMQWALIMEVGATRCVHVADLTCAKEAADSSLILADAEAALKGVLCCFSDSGACRDVEFKINDLTIGGPLGGCGGFTIQLVRQYTMNCCPDLEESS